MNHHHDSDSDSSEEDDLDGRKPLKHIKKMMKLIERGNPSRREMDEGKIPYRGKGGYRAQMRDEGLFRRQPDGLFNAEINPEPSE